jgi:hypothetical protein
MGLRNTKYDNVRYTLYHDSIGNVEIDAPIGWDEDSLEYSRNTKYHGVFTLFSNNLEFYGNSRTIIKNIYDTYGINEKLRLTKEVLEQDKSQVNTMLWVEEYTGFLDFTTYSLSEDKAVCKFNSSNLATLIKSREGIDIEIERETTLDNKSISKINSELVVLTEKDVLKVDQWTLEEPTTYVGGFVTPSFPLLKNISKQHLYDPADVTSSLYGTNGFPASDNFFWVRTEASNVGINLNIDIDINASATFSSSSFYLKRYTWDGSNYILKNSYRLGALPNTNVKKNITFNIDITLELDDSFLLEMLMPYYSDTGQTTLTIYDCNITSSEKSNYTTTKRDNKFVFIEDLLDKLTTIITNKNNIFKSEYFDKQLGIGGGTGFTSGLWIRNFNESAERYKSPKISWKDIISSLDAVFCIGYGIEKQGLKEISVVEDKKYFYQNVVTLSLPQQVSNVTREVYTDGFFNELEIGFSKSGGYESEMGLDEPNAKTNWSTFVTAIKNKYSKVSKVRADSYGKEFARRKPQDIYPTEDTKYDEHNWFLDIKDNGNGFTEKLWADRFEKKPTGVFSPDTLTNIWFSPFNCFLRHSWWFSQGFEKDLYKYTKFTSSTGNSDLKTQLIGGDEYSEKGDILNYFLDRPRLVPELIKFEHPINSNIRETLKGTTNIGGREIPNTYGLIEFVNEYGETEKGYLKSLKPNGKGEWEIIKSNDKPRKAQKAEITVNLALDIFDIDTVDISIVDANANSAPIIGTLSFVSKTSNSVSLSWTAASDLNLDGYYVYYKENTSPTWILFSTETSATTSKTVTGLTGYTSYDFSIIAFDNGIPVLSSNRSNIITEVTNDNIAPIVGTLSSNTATSSSISLTWTEATDNVAVTGYFIYYKLTTDTSWSSINVFNVLSYEVTGLLYNSSYDFKVQAYDGSLNVSSDSNIVTNFTITS